MTELGASYSIVFAVKLASRLGYTPDDVLKMPLAKAIAFNAALDVIDGKQPATTSLTNEDKEIVNFLSENQKDVIEKLKNMRRFK